MDYKYNTGTERTESAAETDTPRPADPDDEQWPDPPVDPGDTRQVVISGIGDQGDPIARVDRGYVLVLDEGDVGDECIVRVTNTERNVGFGAVVEQLGHTTPESPSESPDVTTPDVAADADASAPATPRAVLVDADPMYGEIRTVATESDPGTTVMGRFVYDTFAGSDRPAVHIAPDESTAVIEYPLDRIESIRHMGRDDE